jgi:hypothetical protein
VSDSAGIQLVASQPVGIDFLILPNSYHQQSANC